MEIKIIEPFEQENDEGNIEYKQQLFPYPEPVRFEKLKSQMLYRLNEGDGEAIYELGISDDGQIIGLPVEIFNASFSVLTDMADSCDADATILRKTTINADKWIAEILIRKRPYSKALPNVITIATIGNVDSGKSTLIGTLISGKLDDGEGKNAILVARHKHEIESGRTSSVSTRTLGFNSKGEIINTKIPLRASTDIIKQSSKIIRFIDLAGHERYLKTTIYGLSGYEPDYACVMIDGNRGLQKMSREHIGIAALALKIPVFVLMTKIDLAPPHVYKRNLTELRKLLKRPGLDFFPTVIKDKDDVSIISRKMKAGKIVPIFKISSVRGDGLDLLKEFLNLLKKTSKTNKLKEDKDKSIRDPFLLFIDEVFNVTGVGTVVSGIVQSGTVKNGDQVYLGPFKTGTYDQVRIRSIQTHRVVVDKAAPMDYISLALSFKRNPKINKGMVLTTYTPFKAIRRFKAEIVILHHPSTLRENYNAQIHIKTIRSQAKIMKIYDEREYLRSGDRATVLFEFMYGPQFLMTGFKFVFREGRTKGIGTVTEIIH